MININMVLNKYLKDRRKEFFMVFFIVFANLDCNGNTQQAINPQNMEAAKSTPREIEAIVPSTLKNNATNKDIPKPRLTINAMAVDCTKFSLKDFQKFLIT